MYRLTVYCGTLPIDSQRLWAVYEVPTYRLIRHVLRAEYGTRREPSIALGWLTWTHRDTTWTATLEEME